MCAHCLGHKDIEQQTATDREALLVRGNWLTAKFRGRCSGCGEWYEAGTAICRDGDGWTAECCAEEGL
jgi:hypothetical protein